MPLCPKTSENGEGAGKKGGAAVLRAPPFFPALSLFLGVFGRT